MSVLEATEVSVQYGQVQAVDRVSFAIESGSILGIIGPNGAGKTSLIDAASGFAPLAGGSIRLSDRDITRERPHIRARLGLARTWQSGELFEDLSALENVLVAADAPRWWAMPLDVLHPGRRATSADAALRTMELLGLAAIGDRTVSEIPQDKRRLVSIARALAASPTVVMLDEPAAGLNTEETVALGQGLRRMAAGGLAIVLIDHDMELVLSVCDRILVLDFGRPIAEGSPKAIASDPRVVSAYLGTAPGEESDRAVRQEA